VAVCGTGGGALQANSLGERMEKEHAAKPACSFCGRSQHEVRKLIAGPTVYICDECIKLCNDIIYEEIAREGISGTSCTRAPSSSSAPLGTS